MMQAFRMVREKYASSAFSGEGALRHGGRWNSPGVRLIYTSSTVSLAALETLVHLNPQMHFKYVVFPIKFDEALVKKVAVASLPAEWQVEPPPLSTKHLGDQWVKHGKFAILELSSFIVPGESNFILNTSHPDFKSLSIGKPQAFSFDPRLIP